MPSEAILIASDSLGLKVIAPPPVPHAPDERLVVRSRETPLPPCLVIVILDDASDKYLFVLSVVSLTLIPSVVEFAPDATLRGAAGLTVPMPTLPFARILIFSVTLKPIEFLNTKSVAPLVPVFVLCAAISAVPAGVVALVLFPNRRVLIVSVSVKFDCIVRRVVSAPAVPPRI